MTTKEPCDLCNGSIGVMEDQPFHPPPLPEFVYPYVIELVPGREVTIAGQTVVMGPAYKVLRKETR